MAISSKKSKRKKKRSEEEDEDEGREEEPSTGDEQNIPPAPTVTRSSTTASNEVESSETTSRNCSIPAVLPQCQDVKSDNVLVASDLSDLHLADFGSSRALRTGDIPVTSTTINFSAPEVLAGEIPSEKHDVWGAGLCLYFMLIGRTGGMLCLEVFVILDGLVSIDG